ncbi:MULTISPECIES: hypothetical protein [Paenibacillus]|uniref:Uncharacterized protein n=1 Tax=Paenibacillus violae TaxID=3077234 RepID=A0ABU3R9N3_9BACL|nr:MULTISPECIES: hypothetical protein [Paenibacillus]MDU0200987.1 hypothetical protein [Paenibacillus sp. PFR10]MEC0264844.1 hypothetical protein [Paenibacillus anseongense]
MINVNKGLKWILGAAILASMAVPATVSAKPEAKPEAMKTTKPGVILAAKPEARPEA